MHVQNEWVSDGALRGMASPLYPLLRMKRHVAADKTAAGSRLHEVQPCCRQQHGADGVTQLGRV